MAGLTKDEADADNLFPSLRTMQSLFYIYTILYFFFIYRPSDGWYGALGIVFTVLNAGMILAGLWGWHTHRTSKCKGAGMYGTIVVINSLIGVLVGVGVLILHAIFYIKFKATGKVPFLNP